MCRPTSTLYNKRQIEMLFKEWQCTEPVPPKGKKVLICFPAVYIDVIEVEWTALKSDVGERLWRVTMSSAEGREFHRTVCEAHVVDYSNFMMKSRREENLARNRMIEDLVVASDGNEHVAAKQLSANSGASYSEAINSIQRRPAR